MSGLCHNIESVTETGMHKFSQEYHVKLLVLTVTDLEVAC